MHHMLILIQKLLESLGMVGRQMLIVMVLCSIHDGLHLIGRNLLLAIIGIQAIYLLFDIAPK